VAKTPLISRGVVYAVVGGVIVAALSWVDPVFVPLVLVGPLAHGAVEGWRGTRWRWIAAVWLAAGLLMTLSDLIVNQEDVVFHLALGVVTALLASGAWATANALSRRFERAATGSAGPAG
jgi:hypothetical protein